MINDFFDGIIYISKGCRIFYTTPKAWRYTAFPLIITLIIYWFVFWGVMHLSKGIAKYINELASGLPPWLEWVHRCVSSVSLVIGIIFSLLLLSATICTFYEMFGGFFFDALVEYFEKKEFGITPRRFVLASEICYGIQSVWFGIKTTLIFFMLFAIGLFLPIVGQIFLVVIMGYYMGISYMTASANNNHCSIPQMQKAAGRALPSLMGFGITAYLLQMIPFAILVLLPGFVLGGSMLYHEKIKEYV